MSLHEAAQHLASRGRNGDSLLIHMTPNEVSGLDALARAYGQPLTFNPDTGLPEASFLSNLLPMVLGAGLTVASGGALSPLMAAGITGAGYTLATGSLQKGLMAGLGAYGGGNIGMGIADMGATAIGGEAAAPQLATLQATASPEMFAEGLSAAEMGYPEMLSGAQTAFGDTANAAKTAALQNGYGMSALGRGFSQLGQSGGLGQLTSRLGGDMGTLKMAGMAAAPFFADLAVPRPVTTTQAPQGMVRPMQFNRRQIPGGQQTGDAFTGERRFFEDGLKQFPAYNPTERGYAGGGAVMDVPGFAEGGIQMPDGWAQAGGQYYRVNPVAGGQNILTESQAANLWNAPNPGQYAPAQTPVAPPTPAFGMDDMGNIAAQQQLQMQQAMNPLEGGFDRYAQGYDPGAMANQQLMASGAGLPQPAATATPTPAPAQTGLASLVQAPTPAPAPAAGGGTSGFLSADAAAYYARYPDVKAAWDAQGQYTQGLNPTQFAQLHYETWGGPKEQRIWGVQTTTPAPTPSPAPVPSAPAPAPPGIITKPQPPVPGSAPPPAAPSPQVPPPAGTPAPAPAGGTPPPPIGNPAPPPGPPVGGPQRDMSVTLAMPWGSAARDYFMQNPDVADGFRTNNFGMSADDFARMHFEKFGRNEGRYFRGQAQPRVTRANPFNTTKGASRNALEYLAGEAPLAPQGGATQYQPPSLAGIDKLMAKTKEPVKPDSFAQSYVDRYPDIYLAYQKDPMGMDINEFVRQHYVNYGQKEGRIWGDAQSLKQQSGLDGGGGKAGGVVKKSGFAAGGITALAAGGQGRLLRGPGDGVSDSIPATINGGQPAALADGEFVVPARIVSELGNGSTEAGARQLYAMLDRIQKRRGATTGKGKVAVDSGASRVLPA